MPYQIQTEDGIVIEDIPDHIKPDAFILKAKVQNARQARLAGRGASAAELSQPGINPTEGMSGLDKFAAGAGKAITDTGRGFGQLVGAVSGDDVAAARARDEPLMNTGAGLAGNVAANIGMALAPGGIAKGAGVVARAMGAGATADGLSAAGSLMMAPRTIPQALGIGGVMGAAQPAVDMQERGQNALLGAGATAAIPAAGRLLQAGKSAVEPLYEGGQNAIIGRALNRAAGDEAPAAAQRMALARQLVQGSEPTAAEVAQSPGIAAMQRAAGAIEPQAYGQRAIDQNFARAQAVRDIGGTEGDKSMMEGVRSMMSGPLYDEAAKSKTPLVIGDKIAAIMERPSLSASWAEAEKLARESGATAITPKGEMTGESLHWLKLGMDEQIANAKPGSPMQRALIGTQKELLSWMDKNVPKYGEARQAFASWSKPINAMEIGQELSKKLEPALMAGSEAPTSQRAAAFAGALRDGDQTAARATGFRGATLENTLQPHQLSSLQNVGADLARGAYAKEAGRGVGSDTIQKLSQTNMLEQAGIPTFLRNLSIPQIGGSLLSRGADAIYSPANQTMAKKLAQALLSPQDAAQMMRSGTPSERAALAAELSRRIGGPAGMAAPAISNAQQQQ